MMFFKVMTLITIIGAADNRMLLSELESEQEFPALELNGHVIFPMIYKYAKANKYNTLRSILRPVRSASPNRFNNIQYAPLNEGVSQKIKNAYEEYTKPTPTLTPTSYPVEPTEKNSRLHRKSHLEPRPAATDTKCYATKYKVEASSSVSRSPGHNAVYRIITAPIQRVKAFEFTDYAKPIGGNLHLKPLATTSIPLIDLSSEDVARPLASDEHFVVNPNTLQPVVQEKIKRYSPHGKYHRLHLNIARVYNPGQAPLEPPALPVAYPGNIGRRPPHAQAYLPQAYQDLNHNTILYPVHGHQQNYRLRTSLIHL